MTDNTNDHNDTIQCHDRIDLLNMIDQLEKDGYKYTVDNYTITVIGGIRYE